MSLSCTQLMQIVPVPHEKLLHVFPSASHAVGHDLSLLSFFIQVTDTSVCRFWSCVCLLPGLTSTIKGHKEQCGCGVGRSVAALQLCLLCLLCTCWLVVFEGTGTLAVFLASLFTLMEAPETLLAALFHLLWHHGCAVKLPRFYRYLTCLYLYKI